MFWKCLFCLRRTEELFLLPIAVAWPVNAQRTHVVVYHLINCQHSHSLMVTNIHRETYSLSWPNSISNDWHSPTANNCAQTTEEPISPPPQHILMHVLGAEWEWCHHRTGQTGPSVTCMTNSGLYHLMTLLKRKKEYSPKHWNHPLL